MKLSTILSNNVSFDRNNGLNPVVRFFHSFGNTLLLPAQHLFQGKHIYCVVIPLLSFEKKQAVFRTISEDPQNKRHKCIEVLITVASLAFVIPATLPGILVKGLTVFANGRLSRRYEAVENRNNEIADGDRTPEAIEDAVICLYKRDAEGLLHLLQKLKYYGQIDHFMKQLPIALDGGPSFCPLGDEYGHLKGSRDGVSESRDGVSGHIFGSILQLYVDGKISSDRFFEQLQKLNEYADSSKEDNIRQRVENLPQIGFGRFDVAAVISKVEEYLMEKNFFD